jgi:hypothetical protein
MKVRVWCRNTKGLMERGFDIPYREYALAKGANLAPEYGWGYFRNFADLYLYELDEVVAHRRMGRLLSIEHYRTGGRWRRV